MAFKDYSNVVKSASQKRSNKNNKSSGTSSGFKDYTSVVDRQFRSKTVGLNTLESDLASLNSRIRTVYSGWQTRETMESTRLSLQSMYDRLVKYEDYRKNYGGTDLSELRKTYKSILDDWDNISKNYSLYKNADAYKKENTKLTELYSMSASDVEKAMQTNSNLDEKLKTAKKYDENIKNLTRNSMNLRNPSAIKSFSETLQNAINERDNYLKSIGYDSIESLEKAVSGVAYTTADGFNIKWQDLYNDAYLSEYTQKIKDNPEFANTNGYTKKDVKYTYHMGYGVNDNEFAHIYNLINGDKEAKDYEALKNVNMYNTSDSIRYEYFTPEEKMVFNSIAETQGEEKALEYAELLSSDLRQRRVSYQNEQTKKMAEENPIASSIVSVLSNVGNNALALPFLAMDYADDGSIDENSPLYTGRRMVNTTRNTVEEMIDNDVGQFFYRHGMNTADNVAAMAVSGFGRLGVASKVIQQGIMSSGAVVDTALGAKSRGVSDDKALALGMISGAAEWAFESKAFDALFDSKTLRQSGWKYFVNNIKTEMVGELGTELTNDVADVLLSKEFSQWKTDINSYIASGLSEKEAFTKAFAETGMRYLDVAGGTLLSSGIISGTPAIVGSVAQHSYNKNMGQTIKSNERVEEMFDLASNSAEISSAYETYTNLANKGVVAENISDAQLGSLYSSVVADAKEVLNSNKSTEAEKAEALKTLTRLATVKTENTVKKEARAEYNVGEETKVTKSGAEVNVKDLEIKGGEVSFATENGTVSVDDVTLTQKDAELVHMAKGIAQTDGEEMANLFISQYDGKTSAEEYANSFNLTMAYAKNDYTYDAILNNKGSLSAEQVSAIYAETRIKADRDRQEKIDELNKSMAGKMSYKGFIDDTVIDYENTSAEGKINWKDLTKRQQEAVTFIKGVAQVTGMNLAFMANNPNYNGKYDRATNTITINLDKGGFDVINHIKETIIPSMSHETTHWMKEKSPELWRHLNEIVFSTLTDHYNSNTEQAIKDKIALLDSIDPETKHTEEDAKGRVITEEDLIQAEMNRKGTSEDVSREEIISRACEDMLKMSKQGRKIFSSLSEAEQKSLFAKIKAIIKDLLNWVDELLNSYEATSTEARIMREYKEQLQKASEVWDEMFKKSVEANQSLEKSGAFRKETSAESDVVYSTKEEYDFGVSQDDINSYVDKSYQNSNSKDYLKYLKPSQKLIDDISQDADISEYAHALRDNDIRHIRNSHGEQTNEKYPVTKMDIMSTPFIVENYDKVFYKTNSKGEGGIVYVKVMPENVVYYVEAVTTEYHNEKLLVNKQMVKTGISEIPNLYGLIDAINKKQSSAQYLADLEQIRKAYVQDVKEHYSKDSISNPDKKVKEKVSDRDSEGRKLSEGQMEYFKDSTVRDENGSLMVMYRGDSNEFTVFDRKKTNYANLYGRGFYFTKSKAHAEQYGNTREFYLDIKNPLSPKQNAITKKQMLNFLKAIENDGEDYDLYNYGQDATAESVLNSIWGKGDFEMLQDINAGAIGDLVTAVELFNEVNGTNYDGIVLPTETVTFNSEQAKLTSNLNPTKNKDIRFSMKEKVEETKELIAVHNMQVSELERTLDLGGLPMPSIAIIKAQSGHSEYGDVSLVFNKETIDPKASRLNKVYGGDAWTPTYPTIEYKPNAKVAKKISDKYYELSRKFGNDESRPLYNYVYDMEEQLNRHKGEASLLEELYDDEKMMQLYLLDSGKNKIETIQKEISTELSDTEVEMNEYFIRELGADVVDGVMWDGNGTPMSHRKNYMSKYEDAIRETYKKLLSEVYQFSDEQVQNVLDSTKPADLIRFMRDAYKYRQNGRVTTRTEADYEATKEAIKEAVGEGYRGWVDSLFKGIEEKSGIRNNTDTFTNSGNRRSWEALHWENNLENVVRVMKSQENGQAFFGGVGVWGVSAKEFSSISDIKADSSRLAKMSQEEYDSIKENFGERFQEIAISIMDKSEKNQFIAIDNAMECIVDAIRVSKTKSGILNALRQYRHLSITEATVDDIVSLVTDISNMPTEYFEAKPKRAVELNEIATAIIPDNTSETTKTRLGNMGIKYLEYESGNEQSRLDALNSLEDVRFSEKEKSVYDILGETDRVIAENEKLKADIARLNERLKIERKVTKGNYFNANQLGAVAGHLRNISNSTIDKVELMKGLKEVYSYIAQSPDMIADELIEKCYRIAEAIIEKSKPEVIVDDYYKTILKDIKNTRISFSESQKKEAQNIFDKNWNRFFFGNVIVTDKGIGLESKWQEWASQYPGVFDAEINDGDMVGELYRVISTLREASETIVEYNEEERKAWLVNEIYNQYWNLSPIKTTADKYNERIKQLNFEHRKAMKELRDDYNSRLEAQKLADDIHYGKKVADVRKKTDKVEEKRKADREKFQELYRALRDRKDKEIATAKQHGKERMEKYKEDAERKTRIQSITANALSLNEMLVKNSKDKHVPEIMKGPVTSLLQAIDFSSKRLIDKGEPTQKDISLSKALGKVKDMMVKATNAHEELVELYGHGLDDEIEIMVDSVDDIMRNVGDNEFVLNKMSVTDLQTLDKMVKTIRHAVNKLNEFHMVNHAKGIANLSQESVSYLDSLGQGKVYDGIRGKAKKLLNWNNALPYYVFKRFGSGGMKVYEALQDGWDKFAFNVKKIIDYANNTYTNKEVKEWSKEVKTFKIQIPASDKFQEVKMTVPQIMSMYCLSKREQARGHLFQGGIRVADFKDSKGKIVSQSDGVIFTEKDILTILSSLTKRQKEVADKLQQFMNADCAEWGNEVSMARFGYKAFGEENYFPIQSDKNNLAVNDETEQPNSLFKLLNMSFTKSTTDNPSNRIVISDIFDVFAQHTSDMAKYNALALSVLDSFKWYNFTEKEDVAGGTFKTSGVKQSIERAFGKDGQSYFTTFLKDINGSQEVSRDTIGRGFFSNAKIAAVGANLRVMALQPTSYVRASAVINNKYLTKALVHKPKIKKAEEHCGIALWKSLGYYDTNIQKGVEAQIKHDDTVKDKTVEWSMKGAEIADKVTWGYLWNACELEIRDKRKDLKVGSEEFYTAIGKRLREVIYATQVVDSTMTRSQMMRSTDLGDKMLTAFASEPTLSYNMIQDAYIELSLDARRMGKKEAWKKNGKKIARVLTAYTMTNSLAALIESAFDALRDDDDEEMDMATFMKLYLGNFASDMSITAKIPYIKEVHSIIKGFTSSRSDTQWMEEMTKAATTWYKIINEGKGKPATAIKYSIKGISDLFGLPFYNAYRELMATLNKLDIFTTEDLNEMFGDYSE